VQVPQMFCCASGSKRITWRALELDELGTLRPNDTTLVLRDVPRELDQARYFYELPARQSYRERLSQLEQRLWRDDQLAYVDARYALFAAPTAGAPNNRQLPRTAESMPSAAPPGAPLLGSAPCASSSEPADGARTLVPLQMDRRRTPCAYSWRSDGLVTAQLPTADAPAAGTGLVLRVDVEF